VKLGYTNKTEKDFVVIKPLPSAYSTLVITVGLRVLMISGSRDYICFVDASRPVCSKALRLGGVSDL